MKLIKNPFRLLGAINFIKQLHFYFPVCILIYQNKGVSLADYFMIQGIYLWATLFMEIPSGYFGDLFSRRNNLIFSSLLLVSGTLVWFCGNGFWAILIGELLFGFGDAFSSGTEDAYIYDLSKKYKKTHSFHKILSKQSSFGRSGFFVSAFTGAFLFQFLGMNATLLITLMCYLLSAILYLFLPDIKTEKRAIANVNPFKDILVVCKTGVMNKELRLIMICFAMVGMNFSVFHWGIQPLMVFKEIPVYIFSLVVGTSLLGWTVWSAVAGTILEKIGYAGIMWLSLVLFAAAYLFTAVISFSSAIPLAYLLLPLAAFFGGNRDLSQVASSTLINHRIKSEERSTILSVNGLVSNVFKGGILIAIKPLTEMVGIENVFPVASFLLLPLLWICIKASRASLPITKSA